MGKPDFIIIGAIRSATSTLSSYLFEHPKVHIAEGKEVHFFSDEKIYNQGADWYFSRFYNAPEGEITGEASPSYLNATLAPGRVKNLLPDVKIILCVRNPGERSISHFFWNKSIQLEQHSFEEIFSDDNISEANHYIGNSMYAKGFHWWLHFFDPSQIAVVFFDEIINRPQNVMSEVFDFLNLNPINLSSTIHHHPTHWQDEPHKYKEVLFKINQYVHSDIFTFLQDLQNSGVRVVGEPESIRHSYVGEIHGKKPMISTIQDDLCRLAAYSGEPWLPSHGYFIQAEAHIDHLWESLIWPFIDDCDFSNVLDLAAGHGRNSRKLLESAKSDHLVILDIQEGNIEVCKQRFPNWSNINYIVGSGYDLCGLDDNSISLVYCFDAMVHFTPEVVQSYLIEIYRILREGGRGFLHHSNYTGGKDWKVNPNGRNYMSASLFAEYAQEANLRVVRQRIINWGGSENIDCLSLVEKNECVYDEDSINLNPNVNLALNKPTAQSSVYQPEQYGYDPHGACNGKKTGEFGFHTLKEDQPWWQIDLQGIDQLSYQLSEIKIYNRINCKERACTLNVLLSQDALNWELCYSNDQENIFGGIDGKPLIVNLPHKLARFVRLQLRENEYLHLDEVEIYGIPFKRKGSELDCNQDEDHLYVNFYSHSPDDLEARFAAQNGIDSSLMKGKSFLIRNYETIDAYKLLRFIEIDQLHQDSLISDITAISVTSGLRFGNSIQQLSHAYHIAKAIGVSKIYLPNFWYIAEGKSNISSGIQIINVNKPNFSSEKIVLEGLFFEDKTLAPLSNTIPNHYLAMIDLTEAVNLKHSAEPLGEQDLVIHIRSGDVFQKNPLSGYGQPPLSFYKKIVELPIWDSISLVFEDKSNPIIDPLIDFAKQHCSQVQEISGDIRYDIEYLLRAKILVVGGGTFAPAIAAISRNLTTVYSFLGNFNTWGNPNVSCIIVGDKQDVYSSEILSNNWQNTESQRKLMLEYPMDTLYFAEPI